MKKVLITGGNKGIGLTAVKLFLENGHEVHVIARNIDKTELGNKHLLCHKFDLTHLENIPQLAREIGPVDVLVNNAGVMNSLPYDAYPEDKKNLILKTNIEAPVTLITEFSKSMSQKGSGRIINLASIAGQSGHPDIWYGITKAAIINATKSFSKILGPKGIAVNCIAPGPVEGTALFDVIPESRKNMIRQSVVSGRFAQQEEIAKVIFWLAIEAPIYINGSCIDVNNGAFLR